MEYALKNATQINILIYQWVYAYSAHNYVSLALNLNYVAAAFQDYTYFKINVFQIV